MKFHIRTLRRASRDVDSILNWIANQQKSPQGAASWLRAYERATTALVDAPLDYGLAPEDGFVERELRQFLFKTRRGRVYRGLFTVDGSDVLILRVRGAGQPLLEPDEIE